MKFDYFLDQFFWAQMAEFFALATNYSQECKSPLNTIPVISTSPMITFPQT